MLCVGAKTGGLCLLPRARLFWGLQGLSLLGMPSVLQPLAGVAPRGQTPAPDGLYHSPKVTPILRTDEDGRQTGAAEHAEAEDGEFASDAGRRSGGRYSIA